MSNHDVMVKELREKLDQKLKLFGMSISGGSYDWSTETWWITLDNGCSANYDRYRVAELLLKELDEQRIVLDGACFTKRELDERKQALQDMLRSEMGKRRNPKKALA